MLYQNILSCVNLASGGDKNFGITYAYHCYMLTVIVVSIIIIICMCEFTIQLRASLICQHNFENNRSQF